MSNTRKKHYRPNNANPSYVIYVHAIDEDELERFASIAEEFDINFLQITHYDHFIAKQFNKGVLSA